MIILISLMVLNLVALPLTAWCVVAINRRQRTADLRYSREVLFHHMELELATQNSRLVDRLRALK